MNDRKKLEEAVVRAAVQMHDSFFNAATFQDAVLKTLNAVAVLKNAEATSAKEKK